MNKNWLVCLLASILLYAAERIEKAFNEEKTWNVGERNQIEEQMPD
jgi:hypothetical protein